MAQQAQGLRASRVLLLPHSPHVVGKAIVKFGLEHIRDVLVSTLTADHLRQGDRPHGDLWLARLAPSLEWDILCLIR